MSTPPSTDERRVLAAVDDLRDEMVAYLSELVRLPTVNPPGDRYAECAELIADRLRTFGYSVELLGADGLAEHSRRYPRINVIGTLGAGAPTLHYNGHYDVVPPGSGWTVDPFAAELRDGRVFGRGTCDQKAGLAASVYAVEAIRRAGICLHGSVEQSATPDEESGGFAGVGWLCNQGRIKQGRQDYVVITEPLDPERVCIGHRGVYWFQVTTIGQVGHGSMPGLAVNAVDLMARVLHAFEQRLKPRLAERETVQPVEPPAARHPSLNVNAVHAGQPTGGWQTPAVPDRCTAVFDRRYIVEERIEDVRQEIAALLAELAAEDHAFRFELRELMQVEPLVGNPRGRLANVAAECVQAVTGQAETPFIHSPGTYDQKHVVRRAGIAECIAYGPGRLVLAHQPDEYVDVKDVVVSARVMALMAMRLLGVER